MSATIAMVAADLTKWVAWGPVRVKRVLAYNPQGADVFIQFHQSPVVTAGDVPVVKSLQVPTLTQLGFEYAAGDQALSELTVALSTTEANYTAVGAGGGLDMDLVVDSDFLVTTNTTVAGALVGADVIRLQVWTHAGNPKRLLRVDVKNNSGGSSYPYISAIDLPAVKNSAQTRLMGAGAGGGIDDTVTQSYFFGKQGLSPKEVVPSTGVLRQGCTVVMSNSGDINSTALNNAAQYDLRAIYE